MKMIGVVLPTEAKEENKVTEKWIKTGNRFGKEDETGTYVAWVDRHIKTVDSGWLYKAYIYNVSKKKLIGETKLYKLKKSALKRLEKILVNY